MRLNSGYLIYKSPNELELRRKAEIELDNRNIGAELLQLEPIKTRELRNYLFDLLFTDDELFVDGVDDDDDSPL